MTNLASTRLAKAADLIKSGRNDTGSRRFGDEVRDLRRRLDLTQEQFAKRYNIPIGNLRNWEQSSRSASPDMASRVLIAIISADPDKVAELIEKSKLARSGGKGS